MEELKESLQRFQNQTLETSWNQSQTIQDSNEISIYKGELTKLALGEAAIKIMRIFPKFPKSMMEEIKEAFVDNKFTDERMFDAIKYVRDTYEGWDKLPNIANFTSFDRKVKVYTYYELLELYKDVSPEIRKESLNSYALIDVGLEKPKYAKKEEIEKFKLKKFIPLLNKEDKQ